jgi:hypothetical protein
VACTGAVTDDILSDRAGGKRTNSGDGMQTAHLKRDITKVVTVTVSGDDVGFADVLGKCIQGQWAPGHWDCMKANNSELYKAVLARINRIDGSPDFAWTPAPDSRPISPLNLVLQSIGEAVGDDTQIYIGTYPKIFGTRTTPTYQPDDPDHRGTPRQVCEVGRPMNWTTGALTYTVAEEDIAQINKLTDKLNDAIRTAVNNANNESKDGTMGKRFHVAEADKMFADYSLCDNKQDSWLNNLKVDYGIGVDASRLPYGWCCVRPNAGSFHPTQVGQCAYEDAFEHAIARSQPQIMVTDLSKPPAGCDGERDAQKARLHDFGGKIRDGLIALVAAVP